MRPALAGSLLLLSCAPAQVTVVMNAENNSGQQGTATLTDLGGSTRVVVLIKKSDFDENQPVHLHTGRCGEIGPRADLKNKTLGLGDMRPANPKEMPGVPAGAADGGFVATSADVDLKLSELTTGDWVINVHDALDFSLYVSCGNIN